MRYLEVFGLGKINRCILDNEDYLTIKSLNLKYFVNHYGYIFYRKHKSGKEKIFYLHRIIMKCPRKMFVDHINGNILDNRKSNLRICTPRENSLNKSKTKRPCGFKGVYKNQRKKGFISLITVNYKTKYLGFFGSKEEAAYMYDIAAKRYFGDFASTNF